MGFPCVTNVHEALSYLEGVYQSDEAEKSAVSKIFSANVYIQSPDDVLSEIGQDFDAEEAPAVVSSWLVPLLKCRTRLD